jgi:hypothetical protein
LGRTQKDRFGFAIPRTGSRPTPDILMGWEWNIHKNEMFQSLNIALNSDLLGLARRMRT